MKLKNHYKRVSKEITCLLTRLNNEPYAKAIIVSSLNKARVLLDDEIENKETPACAQ
jgi:hypothetical protein